MERGRCGGGQGYPPLLLGLSAGRLPLAQRLRDPVHAFRLPAILVYPHLHQILKSEVHLLKSLLPVMVRA